ncbi:MAG: heme-binding protein [Acidobacteriaceae bacterium]|jgi:uncharacterized protein GlcG (DUF336 family)
MTGFSHRALQAAYISLLVLAAGAARSDAQSLITEKALSVDSALAVANGALDKCHADGYRVSLTVLDASGLVKVQVRGDGTGPHTLEHSRRKAYTALTFKRTSAETAKAWASSLTAPPVIEGTVGAAGGVPIKAGSETIGAIGVSGAPGGEKDEACANAGIAKIADLLK